MLARTDLLGYAETHADRVVLEAILLRLDDVALKRLPHRWRCVRVHLVRHRRHRDRRLVRALRKVRIHRHAVHGIAHELERVLVEARLRGVLPVPAQVELEVAAVRQGQRELEVVLLPGDVRLDARGRASVLHVGAVVVVPASVLAEKAPRTSAHAVVVQVCRGDLRDGTLGSQAASRDGLVPEDGSRYGIDHHAVSQGGGAKAHRDDASQGHNVSHRTARWRLGARAATARRLLHEASDERHPCRRRSNGGGVRARAHPPRSGAQSVLRAK